MTIMQAPTGDSGPRLATASAPPSPPSGHYPQPRTYPAAHLPEQPLHRRVVVVGAGPVGLAAAHGLANRGVPVSVLEAGDSASHGSRAICLSRHSLEVLDRLGVGPALRSRYLPWSNGRSFYRNHEALAFQMPAAGHDVHPPMVNISQGVLEQVLVDTAEKTDVELLWGVRVIGVEPSDDAVTLTVQTLAGIREVRADWVIAADGARSNMRRLLGLPMRGTSYEGRYVIADIHLPAELPTERRVWFDPDSAPGSTIIMHRQPDDIWRVDYQLLPEEDAELELAADRINQRITRHLTWLGINTPWTLEWSSIYRAHSLSLDDYVHGRTIFAGDAAHLVPIFGVRGLNSGIEDADTLAWQLASVVHGTANPALLAAYSAERRDAWAQNITAAEKSTRIMSPQRRSELLTRDALLALAIHDARFRPLLDPRQSTATHARRSPLSVQRTSEGDGVHPGDPLNDQAVDVTTPAGARRSTLFAELGTGFSLIGIDVNPHDLARLGSEIALAVAPEPVQTAVISTAVNSAPGSLRLHERRIMLGQPGDVVMVRPDGLVLCRISWTNRGELPSLARELSHLDPAGDIRPDQVPCPPESSMERAWTSLNDALDNVDDPLAFLTRFTLALAPDVDAHTWDAALRVATPETRDRQCTPRTWALSATSEN